MEPPRIRSYVVTSNGKVSGIAGALLVIAVGALLVAFGLTLLAGLAVVGTASVLGVVAYRRVRGGIRRAIGRPDPHGPSRELDPANEVLPPAQAPKRLDGH